MLLRRACPHPPFGHPLPEGEGTCHQCFFTSRSWATFPSKDFPKKSSRHNVIRMKAHERYDELTMDC
jgi:hypothetical protein